MPKVDHDHELIVALQKLSKKSPKLVRSSEYAAPADPNITIRSWKMNEFKYYDIPSPFPTLARGLFTRWISDNPEEKSPEGSDSGRYTIVARGYDKFFNIGEVPWTNVGFITAGGLCALTDSFIVESFGNAYRCSLLSYAQVKWLHHLYRRSDSGQARCHF